MIRSHRLFAVAAVAAGLLAAPAARAAVYDVAADFSFNTNPSPVWTYAFAGSLGGSLTALDTPFGGPGTARGWSSSLINVSGTPVIYRNDSGAPILGTPVGGVAMHPGPDGSTPDADLAVIRFIAPETALYDISAQFFAGDQGNTDAYVLLNALGGTPLFSAASTTSNPLYTDSRLLNAGDTLDFVVGTGGDGFTFDTTPVAITLNSSPVVVPEPGSVALVLSGAGLLGMVLRRRKVH